jgi:hypothetical protein
MDTITIPTPCIHCGWQYPEATLLAARAGETTLDTNPTHRCVPRTMGTLVTCDCGFTVELDGPSEVQHYVWAKRRDGSRSNLGHCPIRWGVEVATMKAAASLGHGVIKGWES